MGMQGASELATGMLWWYRDLPSKGAHHGHKSGGDGADHRCPLMLTLRVRERLAHGTARLMGCMLAAAALTAFLVHLGAADPWQGGAVVPATVWLAWTTFDFASALRRAARRKVGRQAVEALAGPALVDTESRSTPP